MEEIKTKYGERISSRIKELCVVLELKGTDRRNKVYMERIKKIKDRQTEGKTP
jgi:hypothetical protein